MRFLHFSFSGNRLLDYDRSNKSFFFLSMFKPIEGDGQTKQ